MDLKTAFEYAALSSSPSGRPEDFLGQIFPFLKEEASPLFSLLSFGDIHAHFPWSYDVRSLDCFLLLFTRKGCGKLLLNSRVISLEADTLLLLDCGQRFRMDIAIDPWEYQLLFFTGEQLSYFRSLFPGERYALITLSPYSNQLKAMEVLSTLVPGRSKAQDLIISDRIGHLITNCMSELLKKDAPPISEIPVYIEELRLLFDEHFSDSYSLNMLEKQLGVSKYRLCREFHEVYSLSPIQYLNRRRIEMAEHFLLTTDHKVHVIGAMVGIENTNHFITLFKKFTGTTPQEYRLNKLL